MRKLAIVFVLAMSGMVGSVAAQEAAAPAKISVAPVNALNQMGSVAVQLQLQDANGHAASAAQNTNAEVQVEQASGHTATYPVTFAKGESAKQINIPIGEAGLAKLSVKQSEKQLIGASAFVLVRPAKPGKAGDEAKQKQKEMPGHPSGPGARVWDLPRIKGGEGKLMLASASLDQSASAAVAEAAMAPNLVLTVSGEDANGGTPADGTTCAVVQVFYLGSDLPGRDIQVWLSPSNGVLDNNPVVIRKGTESGKGCWTSKYPFQAAVLAAGPTNPPGYTFGSGLGGSDPRKVTHKFSDNISGIEFVNIPPSITIVDSFNLTARFKGPSGPVKLSDQREVDFSANSAVLNVKPQQTVVPAGAFDSSTVLVPTFFGQSKVEAFTPDYPPVMAVITITWVGVLVASLLGGGIGGLLGWINSQGKLWVRIVTGLIVGLVASWAYVVVGLPKLETAFLHNQLSVFFVALIVGIGGVKSLAFIAPKLNLPAI
jgi:hypothetical protein